MPPNVYIFNVPLTAFRAVESGIIDDHSIIVIPEDYIIAVVMDGIAVAITAETALFRPLNETTCALAEYVPTIEVARTIRFGVGDLD